MNILIIGGCGYIGSRLYQDLMSQRVMDWARNTDQARHHVDTVDLEWFGNHINPRNRKMDYRDLTTEDFKGYDVVILLAGYSSPTQCENSGGDAVMRNNLGNFAHLLTVMPKHIKFIYASSITVYEGQGAKELTEDVSIPFSGMNLYETSKRHCDHIMEKSEREWYGLRLATLGGSSPNFREDIMVNAMTSNGLQNGEIKVFNPSNRKPMLYIGDLVRAVRAIIENPDPSKKGFYNLASFNASVQEIAEDVASVMNAKLTIVKSVEMEQIGLPTTAYDLTVSNKKFEDAFDFKFNGTVSTMVSDIMRQWNTQHPSKRIDGIPYGL